MPHSCAGKGLTLVCSVLEGKFQERSADALAAKQVKHSLISLITAARHDLPHHLSPFMLSVRHQLSDKSHYCLYAPS